MHFVKKLFKFAVILTLFFTFSLSQFITALAEENPESSFKVTKIGFDPALSETVRPGDEVHVYAETTGDPEHNYDYFEVVFENQANNSLQEYADLTYNPSTQRYEGSLTVPEYNANGTWHVARISANNENDDQRYNIIPSQDGEEDLDQSFEVTGSIADTTAPVINSIDLSPAAVDVTQEGANMVQISADASDDVTGIPTQYNVLQVTLSDSSNSKEINVDLKYNEQNKKFEAVTRIPDNATDGTWHVSKIHGYDRAGNELNQNVNPGDNLYRTFTVNNGNKQTNTAPPVIKSITFDMGSSDSAKPGQEVHVVADVDAPAGISTNPDSDNFDLYLTKYESDYWNEEHVSLSYNSETHKYEGTLSVPKYNADGIWYICLLNIRDDAENTLHEEHTYSDHAYQTITVSGSTVDTIPPKVNSGC